jgi:putative NADH-flavin reductase
MKLLVFGSTGETGRELVSQAFGRGHGVTACARGPDRLNVMHPNIAAGAER